MKKTKTVKEKTKTKSQEKSDKLFSLLDSIFKHIPIPDNDTITEHFMIQRFMSMSESGFYPSAISNLYGSRLPSWAVVKLLAAITPRHNRAPRGGYIKGIKPPKTYTRELLDKVESHFCCNTNHAIQIVGLFELQGFNVYGMFGLENP